MSPQELLNSLIEIQQASNLVTITHASLSHSLGEFIAFLGSDDDFNNIAKYRDAVNRHLYACSESLDRFCKTVTKLTGGNNE